MSPWAATAHEGDLAGITMTDICIDSTGRSRTLPLEQLQALAAWLPAHG